MPFSVRYNSELNAVETNFSGSVTEAQLRAQIAESCEIAATHGAYYAISSFTEAELRISIAFIYNIPELYEQIGANRPIRLALVNANEMNDEIIGFYQLVSQNRGWNVAVFNDKREAEAWLRD
ncbi:MAG: hypothetical protein AAGI69_03125 [Cyanobacteria bacterium P01_H01_bin.21]